jgi:hypothetical protein
MSRKDLAQSKQKHEDVRGKKLIMTNGKMKVLSVMLNHSRKTAEIEDYWARQHKRQRMPNSD